MDRLDEGLFRSAGEPPAAQGHRTCGHSGAPRRQAAAARRLLVVLAPDGTVARTRPVMARPVIGRPFSELFDGDDQDAGVPGLLLRTATARGTATTEGWRRRRNGSRHRLEIRLSCRRDGDGRVVGYVAMMLDEPDHPGPVGEAAVGPELTEVLFNRLFAIWLTLRRVAGSAAAPVRADRVEAAIEELDAVISELRRQNGQPAERPAGRNRQPAEPPAGRTASR